MSAHPDEQALDLRAAIRLARKQGKQPQQSVLDALAQSTGLQLLELKTVLEAQAGVRVVLNASDVEVVADHAQALALRKIGGVLAALGCTDLTAQQLVLLTADPWDPDFSSQAQALMGSTPVLGVAPAQLLNHWLNDAPGTTSITPRIASSSGPSAPGAGEVVAFVDSALRAAFAAGASDVHFEYGRMGMTVKLRQDGVMVDHSFMPLTERADEIISRIKVLAQLDITERRTPQDGRFRFAFEEGQLDLRVSIMPSVLGEDAVLRLLDKAQLRANQTVSLDLLGFDESSSGQIRELAELPHGMMLVTGPTGSGKTTTVYAILSEVNNGREKIITIEDPVEYELSGVLQIPVNERKNLTFAKGLRSILRHDPDRILVGEIRDAETAEIAVQSALTGHQVFTTVHANSIFDVIGRFRHFGLDMFGFMSALNGVVVQRLVRRLCPLCAGSRPAGDKESRWLSSLGEDLPRLPQAVGCGECRHTGYRGRLVIAQVHRIDDEFRDLVTSSAPVSQLRRHAQQSGVRSLEAYAARLVKAALTTTEEVKRVVGWQ